MLNTQLKFSSDFQPQTDGQTEVISRSLGDLLRCLVGEHINNWDQILPMAEFAYNSSVNQSTDISPFEIVTGLLPRKPIDLVPLPIEARPNVEAEAFSKHKQDLNDDVRRKTSLSNENYKARTDLKRKFDVFKKGDMVMVRIRLKRFPKGWALQSIKQNQFKCLCSQFTGTYEH